MATHRELPEMLQSHNEEQLDQEAHEYFGEYFVALEALEAAFSNKGRLFFYSIIQPPSHDSN